jgi:hypothetical protein
VLVCNRSYLTTLHRSKTTQSMHVTRRSRRGHIANKKFKESFSRRGLQSACGVKSPPTWQSGGEGPSGQGAHRLVSQVNDMLRAANRFAGIVLLPDAGIYTIVMTGRNTLRNARVTRDCGIASARLDTPAR